eukprot:jgi/Botrbrau1/2736/Bobra.0164s0016.1
MPPTAGVPRSPRLGPMTEHARCAASTGASLAPAPAAGPSGDPPAAAPVETTAHAAPGKPRKNLWRRERRGEHGLREAHPVLCGDSGFGAAVPALWGASRACASCGTGTQVLSRYGPSQTDTPRRHYGVSSVEFFVFIGALGDRHVTHHHDGVSSVELCVVGAFVTGTSRHDNGVFEMELSVVRCVR